MNFENKPIHDKVTNFTSTKLWSLFRNSLNFKCSKTMEYTGKFEEKSLI